MRRREEKINLKGEVLNGFLLIEEGLGMKREEGGKTEGRQTEELDPVPQNKKKRCTRWPDIYPDDGETKMGSGRKSGEIPRSTEGRRECHARLDNSKKKDIGS